MGSIDNTGALLDLCDLLTQITGDDILAPANIERDRDLGSWVVSVPELQEEVEPGSEERLVWRAGKEERYEAAEWCLDEFVVLAEGESSAIRHFAGRFGPFGRWTTETDDPPDRIVRSEPLSLWRVHASALRALLAVSLDLISLKAPVIEKWAHAMLATAVPSRVSMKVEEQDPAEEISKLLAVVSSQIVLGYQLPQSRQLTILLGLICNALLDKSGVRAGSGIGAGGAIYSFPARDVRMEPESGKEHWIATGLLPVLAVQAESAIRGKRIFPCNGCGQPIPLSPAASLPRRGVSFYGNHEHCRRAARLQSKRESAARRTRRGSQALNWD